MRYDPLVKHDLYDSLPFNFHDHSKNAFLYFVLCVAWNTINQILKSIHMKVEMKKTLYSLFSIGAIVCEFDSIYVYTIVNTDNLLSPGRVFVRLPKPSRHIPPIF